jgi:hypothetical protein
MKITHVQLNDTTKTLLAKGPGRFRFARGTGFYLGGNDLAPSAPEDPFPGLVIGGDSYAGNPEFILADDEKVFGLLLPGDANPLPVVVAKYGV